MLVGIATTNPLFGKCGDAKLIVSVSLSNFAVFQMEVSSPVLLMKATCAGLAMVTFLSWIANVRTSSCIGRILAGKRNGLTLRSVESNSMFPLVLCLGQEWRDWHFFGLFWLLFQFLVHMGSSSLGWSPCCVQDLGCSGVPPAGTRPFG